MKSGVDNKKVCVRGSPAALVAAIAEKNWAPTPEPNRVRSFVMVSCHVHTGLLKMSIQKTLYVPNDSG